MVSFVWWILSLFGVCAFSWWPVLIEGLVMAVAVPIISVLLRDDTGIEYLLGVCMSIFAAAKLFLGLSISGWWILAGPIWFTLASFIPGGFTITNLVFSHFGLMECPTWLLVVGIVCDVLFLIRTIMRIWEEVS